MPFINSNDGSGQINTDFLLGLVAYSANASNFTIAGRQRPGANMHAGGTGADVSLGVTYTSKAAAQAAVAAFVERAGYPWVVIGAVPDPVSNGQGLVAVNLANVAQMEDDLGNGVSFNSGAAVSMGYAPWVDGPTALAALQALTGTAELT